MRLAYVGAAYWLRLAYEPCIIGPGLGHKLGC